MYSLVILKVVPKKIVQKRGAEALGISRASVFRICKDKAENNNSLKNPRIVE